MEYAGMMHEADYHDRIQFEALLLWEQAGRPEGKSAYFWHLAEKKLCEQRITGKEK